MTCKDALEFLMAYLDGELSAEQRAAFDQHLSICRGCRDYLASYQATVRLERTAAGGDDATAATTALPDDLVRAILAARDKTPGCP